MKKIFFLSILLVFSIAVNAQDLIRTKTDSILSKVVEIGIDEIKYYQFNNLNGPVYVIRKSDVLEIIYENGSRYFIAPDPYDVNKEVAIRHKSRAIKFEFFSPLTRKLVFGYETMLKVGTNLEFKIGIIGPGTGENSDNVKGFLFKGGVKFLTSPSYVQNGVKYSHQLKGFYIKPELVFNTYTKTKTFYSSQSYWFSSTPSITKEVRYVNAGVQIIFGKQHILGNVMTLDWYFGGGYGFQSKSNEPDDLYKGYDGEDYYAYSHLFLGSGSPLILSTGLTIGFPF
jgi:hypothetical protein